MAVQLGIAPSALADESAEMLATLVNYVNWRNEVAKARK